jgi:hypothetical protein
MHFLGKAEAILLCSLSLCLIVSVAPGVADTIAPYLENDSLYGPTTFQRLSFVEDTPTPNDIPAYSWLSDAQTPKPDQPADPTTLSSLTLPSSGLPSPTYDLPKATCHGKELGPGWRQANIISEQDPIWYRIDGWARGYYMNDQRIAWSGVEATFGAEGAIVPVFYHQFNNFEMTAKGEFYINEPYDRNVFLNTAERRSYAANWQIDTLEISELYVSMRRGDWEFTVGKIETPFGRTYFPLYSNSRIDAPFIRTEVIHWRETGFLIHFDPHPFVCDVSLTNGCDNGDTNSSKALVSRIGLEYEHFATGASIKIQDGIGSELQKEFNNHIGADMMYRWGRFILSGEVAYDQHGFRKPYDPMDITWIKSIYYRDAYKGYVDPIGGVGYYVNLGIDLDPWTINLNYGDYYPEKIGNALADMPNHRGIVKADYRFTKCLDTYLVVMKENDGYIAQDNRKRIGVTVLTGLEFVF